MEVQFHHKLQLQNIVLNISADPNSCPKSTCTCTCIRCDNLYLVHGHHYTQSSIKLSWLTINISSRFVYVATKLVPNFPVLFLGSSHHPSYIGYETKARNYTTLTDRNELWEGMRLTEKENVQPENLGFSVLHLRNETRGSNSDNSQCLSVTHLVCLE